MGAFLFLLVLFLAILLYGISALDLEIGTMGSPATGFFPVILAGVALVLGIGCVGTALLPLAKKKRSNTGGSEAGGLDWTRSWRLLVVFSICLLYALILQWVGYLTSNVIVALLMLSFSGIRVRNALPLSVLIGGCLYLLIVQVLAVHMPEGNLWFR